MLVVPENPVVPFIEGDGTGPDIWRASVRVLDAAVAKAYGGKRKIAWMEVLAGQKAYDNLETWLPDETVKAFQDYLVGIKGPLTTPIGGGIRSLNVRPSPAPRPLRLPPPGPLVQGRPVPGEASREGRHGHLPGEHRGHLRRHRVRVRERRREEGPRVPQGELAGDVQEDPLPGDVGHRHQAGLEGRAPSGSSVPRSTTRSRTSARASPSSTRATS